MGRGALLFLAGMLVCTPLLTADVITINFDGLTDGTPVTTQFPGLVFSDATVITAGISLNEFEFPPHSGTNVVFDDSGPMSITFLTPVTNFSGYFTYGERLTLTAFDTANNALAPVQSLFLNNEALSGDLGSTPNELLSASYAAGISRIIVAGDLLGASFTVDDVSITPSAVPEPSSPVYVTGALAMLLLAARRQTSVRRQ